MTTPWEEGSQDAKIVLIGGAPARYEIGAGRPFVGPAGYILEEALHSARLVRRDCYITNVFMEEIRKDKEGKTFYSTKRDNLLNPTFQEAEEFLIAANRQKEIATDIEVYNYQVSCFSVAVSPTLILSVPLFNGHKDTYSEGDELNIWKLYADILSNEKVKKIGQNLSFDSWFLYHQNGIFMKGPISDTMIAQSIMYPDFPKGLDFICSIRTREPYYKDDRKLWSRISDDPDTFG